MEARRPLMPWLLGRGELSNALAVDRTAWVNVSLLSMLVNVLMLSGSIFLMLVYDYVLPSHSMPTLAGLFGLVVFAYGFQAAFDGLRSRLLVEIATAFHQRVGPRVMGATLVTRIKGGPAEGMTASGALRDLDAVRGFMAGPAPSAFFDLPWLLIFLLVLGLLHIWLAVVTLLGAILLSIIAHLTYRSTLDPAKRSGERANARFAAYDERLRHAETIQALGMGEALSAQWNQINNLYLDAQYRLSHLSAYYGGISRMARMVLQSLILTVGALLVINGKASGGVIFASSLLSGRALAPIDQIISHWRSFAGVFESWIRLQNLLDRTPPRKSPEIRLPKPEKSLQVSDIYVSPPGAQRITAYGASFTLSAGDVLGVIGLSGSGKTSLVRAIVGAWQPVRGTVRLDGATLDQYEQDVLGRYIGYLPQSVELMTGTVAQNISRFNAQAHPDDIIAAARSANAHDLIVSFPNGYETVVGIDGEQLSGGQRQRIALARALYGTPFLIVLDEPNSNLDTDGEAALLSSIRAIQKRGGITVVVAHNGGLVSHTTKLLFMEGGAAKLFGGREAVLARVSEAAQSQPEALGVAEA